MPALSSGELAAALGTLPAWHGDTAAITRTYQFQDFVQAVAFVDRVAVLAETANHHPDIDIRYNKVLILLTTHDEGGVSRKDVDLARQIDAAAQ